MPTAKDILAAVDKENTIQPKEMVRLFPGRPRLHQCSLVSTALRAAGCSQREVDRAARNLGWADPPRLEE